MIQNLYQLDAFVMSFIVQAAMIKLALNLLKVFEHTDCIIVMLNGNRFDSLKSRYLKIIELWQK